VTPPPPADPAGRPAAADPDDAVELVVVREPAGYGFHFRARAGGRVYRLDAVRDPHLPRFWCFRVSRCDASGVVDLTERPWFGGDRMAREGLPEAVAAIRAAPGAWLALPENAALRAWVLTDAPADASLRKLPPALLRRVLGE
jgi:hypothetical protein